MIDIEKDLTSVCQKYCEYQINDPIQELDLTVDIERLRKEIFSLIIKNNYGTKSVSLKLFEDTVDWTDEKETVHKNGIAIPKEFLSNDLVQIPKNNNIVTTHWHPDIEKGYIPKLATELESLSGFPINKVRLAWLQSQSGYQIHWDAEPIRLHIPILTNDFSYIIHGDSMFHMEYGKLYHLLTTKAHTAFNFGKLPRLHLIFSTHINEEIEKEIKLLESFMQKHKESLGLEKVNGLDKESLYFLYKILGKDISDDLKKNLLYLTKYLSDSIK